MHHQCPNAGSDHGNYLIRGDMSLIKLRFERLDVLFWQQKARFKGEKRHSAVV